MSDGRFCGLVAATSKLRITMRQVVRKTEFPGKPRRYSRPETEFPPTPLPDRSRASRCCPYPGLQRRWTCPIRAVIASRAQTVHFAQCGRAEGVRPPDGVDRDPFAIFAACGDGR